LEGLVVRAWVNRDVKSSLKYLVPSSRHISTLSKIIEAMGGELQIVAKMPNGNVKIRQFTQIRQDESETASALS
jgi:hypothetical protein